MLTLGKYKTALAALSALACALSANPIAGAVTAEPTEYYPLVGNPWQTNQHGTWTVKCHVHELAPGNNVVGYVVGHSGKSADEAERSAANWLAKFVDKKVDKRHCYAQRKFIQEGAYDTSMRRIP